MSDLSVVETFRKLASIVIIDDVIAHPNADKLEIVIIGGWQCGVVIGKHKKGELAVYCEIDSLVPTTHPEFAFLEAKGENLKNINDVSYCRIKTMKLRKELSQGLVIHVPKELKHLPAGTDVSAELGVLKYEKPSEKQDTPVFVKSTSYYDKFAAWVYGKQYTNLKPWPSFLAKSEQPRIQNMNAQYVVARDSKEEFEESVKLDGASLTVYSLLSTKGTKVGLCSRNFEISQEDITFTFGQACRRWLGELLIKNKRMIAFDLSALSTTGDINLPKQDKKFFRFNFVIPKFKLTLSALDDSFYAFVKSKDYLGQIKRFSEKGVAFTFQGELVGPGISSNFEGLADKKFFVYNVYHSGNQVLLPELARQVCKEIGFDYVPVLNVKVTFPEAMKELLKKADGPRALAKGGYREGLVYKSNTRDFSVKVISNKYLDKEE